MMLLLSAFGSVLYVCDSGNNDKVKIVFICSDEH